YRQISEAMDAYFEKMKQVRGQDFFRDSMKDLFVSIGKDINNARDALDQFFDRLRTRALEAIAERLMDKLFGPRESTQAGAAGGGFAAFIGSLFGGYADGGY